MQKQENIIIEASKKWVKYGWMYKNFNNNQIQAVPSDRIMAHCVSFQKASNANVVLDIRKIWDNCFTEYLARL